jgi:hypothetical protein
MIVMVSVPSIMIVIVGPTHHAVPSMEVHAARLVLVVVMPALRQLVVRHAGQVKIFM